MAAGSGTTLPTTLITGFLGSGKTTLLNRLLAHPEMADTAVIVNEFGEVGLDHLLIETAFEDAVLLRSGCICCTVRGDLVDTLATLHARRARGDIPPFARVAIETTGLADPAPILHTLMGDPTLVPLFHLARVVTTVDAVNAATQLAEHYEAAKQVALADRLVLTKTDLVDAAAAARLGGRLAALNPAAPIVTAVGGKIAPAALFGGADDDQERSQRLAAAAALGHVHDHDAGPSEADADHLARHHRIAAVSLIEDRPVPWPPFQAWLKALAAHRGADLLRVKGIVHVAGRPGPVIVHGVQHLFHPPVELARWPDGDRRTRLTFIVRDISAAALRQAFAAVMAEAGAAEVRAP